MSDIEELLEPNSTHKKLRPTWEYHLSSYLGGDAYKKGKYLTKYSDEGTDAYQARIDSTFLDNQCASIISVYNSFLFRVKPIRELGTLEGLDETEQFLKDADFDGRSIDSFMSDVSIWSSVYGHCWILLAKPNINAETRADEIALEIRPYASLLTPMVVLDWQYARQANGLYVLDYFKYIESETTSETVLKEWTNETIRTITIDREEESVTSDVYEDNGLMKIPATIAYATRSTDRGIGISDINDVADSQRYLYNCNSEMEQSMRVDSHPSLVKTSETVANAGAGSVINMPDQMDPGLKPYLLQSSGADINAVLNVVNTTTESISRMTNTGGVQATQTRVLSGVAMETEFQLLNARLSGKADNLELAEEQMWRFFADYQGKEWNGTITYPDTFSIRDKNNDMLLLKNAKDTTLDSGLIAEIDRQLAGLLGVDSDDVILTGNIQESSET